MSSTHPSQIQKSAVTTKAGCQGDPLYLSIKGTPYEGILVTSRISNASGVGTLACELEKQDKNKSHST